MTTGTYSLRTKFGQISALLLTLLFLSIAAAPLFHHHDHAGEHTDNGQEVSIQVTDQCLICDYYHHIQGKQILLYHPQIQILVNTGPITLENRVFISNYKFTLQGFTNKGPPGPAFLADILSA